MAGEIIDAFGGFEFGPAHGLGEFKIAGAGSDEGGHMAAGAEEGAEIVTVGANVEALGAVNAKPDGGEGDF